ncbi:MAG TPA: DUF1611 domain-containing protein [Fimbriimonas sp.]
MLNKDQRVAIFMEGATGDARGKMGFGVIRYSPNPIACVVDSEQAGRDMAEVAGMPKAVPIVATVEEAVRRGAEVLILGIAPTGGLIPSEWYATIDDAVARGLSILNGLHDLLAPRYPNLDPGQWVWDVRVEPEGLQPSSGRAAGLGNLRVLLVGTDMGIGKMTTGLEIFHAARAKGIDAEFVATGQIGITVTGRGVPLDAIRMDFAAGAIEAEVMRAAGAELVLIEGQGSIVHPGSSATLPLIRGAMPTHLVLCHRAGQRHLWRLPEVPIPPLSCVARLYQDIAAACGTYKAPTVAAVALNTFHIESDDEAARACRLVEDETGLPCLDPVRHGADRLLLRILDPSNVQN